MKGIEPDKVVPNPSPAIQDTGKVRVGFIAPVFPPARSVADNGKVRIGFIAPVFRPARAR